VWLPREVRDQYLIGEPVRRDNLAAGDLLFFTTTAPGASHVAIALGREEFVHAPSSTGVVRVERLDSRYWALRYLGARRLSGRFVDSGPRCPTCSERGAIPLTN
jgi:cell wall-associated NlpC family hydrolase